jgi:uncharacterized protein DUF1573
VSFLGLILCGGCYSDSPRQDPQTCCGEGRVPTSQTRPATILTHDFGLVGQQQTLQHTFVIKNTTDREVTFTRAPDIGFPCCVEIEITSDVVPPNGSVEVNLYFHTEARPGPFDVFIRLYPDSEKVPAHIHIGGVVKEKE